MARVVPTRVGVDLHPVAAIIIVRCCPHTRGGGPVTTVRLLSCSMVVPTRVGVDRLYKKMATVMASLSPHAWGWTGSQPHDSLPT